MWCCILSSSIHFWVKSTLHRPYSFDVEHAKQRLDNPLTWKPKKLVRIENAEYNRKKKMRNIQNRQGLLEKKMEKAMRKEELEQAKEKGGGAGGLKRKGDKDNSAGSSKAKRIKKEQGLKLNISSHDEGSEQAMWFT